MKQTKQTVYLPVNGDGLRVTKGGYDTYDIVEKQHGYFFTPEQLNEYTANVIKEALQMATNNVELDYGEGRCRECGSDKINEQSITDTFEETFKLYQV